VTPISVLFTGATSFQQVLDEYARLHPGSDAASTEAKGWPHRFRVVVGAGGRVLKDNTGFCRNDDGTFKAPVA
jgi:hypothetical protein